MIRKILKIVLKYRLVTFPFCILLILLGFLAGFVLGNNHKDQSSIFKETRSANGFKFTNPLLECEPEGRVGSVQFKNLETRLQNYINNSKGDGLISNISVYFRDLNNGPWIGVNEKDDFTPSSLLKLPVMIGLLKMAESDPSLMSKKLTFRVNPEDSLQPTYKPTNTLDEGKFYTVEELINQMIINSDNQAKDTLLNNLDQKSINQVYIDLGIIQPPEVLADDYMSTKEYASLFRVLFNSSYLSKDHSEQALELLTKTNFNIGLVAGVPANIIVAHKFGERQLPNNINQLHDCGIVYFPKHPYLLCIMTRGSNKQVLPQVISDISKLTYQEIKNKYQ